MIHCFNHGRFLWVVLFFLIQSGCLTLLAQSIPNSHRKRARFLELAHKAKTAQRIGQQAKAQELWSQAQILAPRTIDPDWLESLPPAKIPPDPAKQRVALLASAAKNLDTQCVTAIEKWLIRYPWDTEVRLLLLANARKTGNRAQERRHASFLGENPDQTESQAGKIVLIAVLMGLLVWQTRELWTDYRKNRR